MRCQDYWYGYPGLELKFGRRKPLLAFLTLDTWLRPLANRHLPTKLLSISLQWKLYAYPGHFCLESNTMTKDTTNIRLGILFRFSHDLGRFRECLINDSAWPLQPHAGTENTVGCHP